MRVVLNAIFNSFPTLDDLDPVKKDKYSLFNNSLLYSHYKISFNLHTVFIAFFLYPGKF